MALFRHATVWGCGALLVVMSLGQALCKAPLLRIIELNLCRSYYQSHKPRVIAPDGDMDERLCKVFSIQKDLATINAYSIVCSALVELLTAFPYASLCGRFNRRTILLANVASAFAAQFYTMCICYFYQTFSTKLVWAQSLCRLFGGGDSVLLSLTNALIAESLPVANLSKTLFSLNAMRLFVNAASQTVGARLMQENLWIPVIVGISVHGLTIPALLLIADPRYRKHKPPATMTTTSTTTTVTTTAPATAAAASVTDPLLGSSRSSSQSRTSTPAEQQEEDESLLGLIWHSLTSAFWTVVRLCRDPIAAPTLVVFFWNELGHGVNNIVQQWVGRTFSWTLASTNYFLAAQRGVAGITLIGLSVAVHRLQVAGVPSARLDLCLVAFCQSVTLLGIFGTVVSSLGGSTRTRSVQFVCSVLVYMMGWGMNGALQSIVTRVSHPDHITLLYTGLNVAERMAAVGSGPAFAGLLAKAMQKGGEWEYLPYWVSFGIFLLVSALTVRLIKMLARL